MSASPLPDLLQMSPAAGCGCKLPMEQMNDLMTVVDRFLADHDTSNVTLDSQSRDDAGLFDLGDGNLLATSVDYGTPISSSAETWGRIAALNALSDIYAMGAVPLFAVSMVGWPAGRPSEELTALISGALQALQSEQTPLIGGHTITSDVPHFGLSVTGRVHADSVMLVRNAKPGHYLLLTKPLGTGVITAAQKAGVATALNVAESEQVMLMSNRDASRLAVQVGIRAATDVTGYGFLGHLHNMLKESGCGADIAYDAIPILAGATEALADHGIVPNSAERNYLALEQVVDWSGTPLGIRFLLCDPQTSGGLLLAADEAQTSAYLALCKRIGLTAAVVGRVVAEVPGHINVMRSLPS